METPENLLAAVLYLDFQLREEGFTVDEALGALPPIAQDDEPLGDAEIIELDTAAIFERRSELSAYDEPLRAGTSVG